MMQNVSCRPTRLLYLLSLIIYSGCSDTLGDLVRIDGTSNQAIPISSPSVVPIAFNSTTPMFLAAGEEFKFAPLGGSGQYNFFDSGTGYINSLLGIYNIPIDSIQSVDTVRVVDSSGATASLPLKIQRFRQGDDPYSSSNHNPNVTQSIVAFTATPNGTRLGIINSQYDGQIVRSTDNGLSYSRPANLGFMMFSNEETYFTGIVAKSDSLVFLVGTAEGGVDNWDTTGFVRKSTDAGLTWTTILTFSPNGNGSASDILIDSAGGIIVVGYEDGSTTVRRSIDDGMTWVVTKTFASTSPRDLAQDAISGHLYLATYASGFARVNKSTDNGISWNQVDSFQGSNGFTFASQIAVRNSLVVYIGYSGNSSTFLGGTNVCSTNRSNLRWFTRVSTDGGASWTAPEQFQRVAGYGTGASSVSIMDNGTILVAGYITKADRCKSGLVRISSDSGVTWADARYDNLSYPNSSSTRYVQNGNTELVSVTSQSTYVGTTISSTANSTQISSDGLTWTPRTIQLNIPYASAARGLLSLDDSILVAAERRSSSANPWRIKRSSDLGKTWSAVDSFEISGGYGADPIGLVKIDSSSIIAYGLGYDYL
jgi:hypothetical protein